VRAIKFYNKTEKSLNCLFLEECSSNLAGDARPASMSVSFSSTVGASLRVFLLDFLFFLMHSLFNTRLCFFGNPDIFPIKFRSPY
ncbi:hypothetical protein S245_038195, partial [Arachis hypogaea]